MAGAALQIFQHLSRGDLYDIAAPRSQDVTVAGDCFSTTNSAREFECPGPLGIFSASFGTSATVAKAMFDFTRPTANFAAAATSSTALITGAERKYPRWIFCQCRDMQGKRSFSGRGSWDTMLFLAFAHLTKGGLISGWTCR